MTTVSLSWREVRLAALAGIDRQIYAKSQGLRTDHDLPPGEQAWEYDVVGVIGEWAAAKALGRYWSDHLPGPGDIGGVEVRATTHRAGCLIIHRDDDDASPFVLVCGHPPTLEVAGWITAGDAKREEWWRTDVRNPAYFVPQSALRRLDELVR